MAQPPNIRGDGDPGVAGQQGASGGGGGGGPPESPPRVFLRLLPPLRPRDSSLSGWSMLTGGLAGRPAEAGIVVGESMG